jgi:CDP-paratose 2-epimerase
LKNQLDSYHQLRSSNVIYSIFKGNKLHCDKAKGILLEVSLTQYNENAPLYDDVIQFMNLFIQNPRIAEVYNIGGGKDNSCSILEAFDLVESVSGKKMIYEYVEENRIGDHICYYSDLSKMKAHYPEFEITKNLNYIIENIYKK